MIPKAQIAALIPAYNEKSNIEEVVKRSKSITDNIIVIDDGSIDNTAQLAKQAGAITLVHGENKGKGAALATGFNYILTKLSDVEHIVVIDADMQYEPEDSTIVLQPIIDKQSDFVMGKRDWSTVPFRHRLGNFVWRSLFNLFFGTKLKDISCGFIAMSRKSMQILNEKAYGGYIIESSMLAQCVRKKLTIKQVPVNVTYHHLSATTRGIRMVLGITIFIITEGLKYRLGS